MKENFFVMERKDFKISKRIIVKKIIFVLFLVSLFLVGYRYNFIHKQENGYVKALKITKDEITGVEIETIAMLMILRTEGYSLKNIDRYQKTFEEKMKNISSNMKYEIIESTDKEFSVDKEVIIKYKDVNLYIPVIKNGEIYNVEYEKMFAQKFENKYTYYSLMFDLSMYGIVEWFKSIFN